MRLLGRHHQRIARLAEMDFAVYRKLAGTLQNHTRTGAVLFIISGGALRQPGLFDPV